MSDTSPDGEAIADADRFAAFRLAQHLLARARGAMVLFDEAGGALDEDAGLLRWGRSRNTRAWTHRALEEGPVPALWTANAVGHLAPSVLRRFDYVLELDMPPEPVRQRIAERYLAGLPVGPACVRALAPGDFAVAARRCRIAGTRPAPAEVLAMLAEEVALKGEESRGMGFLAVLG